ncbi:hypothetical protein ADICYQ_3820 [Cyclobacterium qasimii M12-11B]|uniref:Uncharacterized protein n=1 Tax=Cyclobacterium qasimii M12-11B TaxID=641524 RepID=S7VAL9_9BACT|nr:hypothetical protein ADICYQ_3820 [Cyclobacterium qasimii M12-11B]
MPRKPWSGYPVPFDKLRVQINELFKSALVFRVIMRINFSFFAY